jgi:HK97 family phage major capsid protein
MNLTELRAQRAAKLAEAKAIADRAKAENRELTDEEQTQTDGILDAVDAVDAQIDKAAKAEARAARLTALAERSTESLGRQTRAENPATESREQATADRTEIEVHSAFPMTGRAAGFEAVHGERRGREEAYKIGMWTLGHLLGHDDARRWSNDYGYRAVRAMNNSSNTAGAILVPDALQATIIWHTEERGIFARYAQPVPMGKNDVVTVPKSTGEVTVYAVAENMTDDITESEPTLGGVEVIARTWGALVKAGNNLLDDAVVSVGEYIGRKVGYAHADKQDQAGFNGDGTSTYHSIRGLTSLLIDGNHTASVAQAASGNNTFGTLDMDDFEAAVGKLPQWAEDEPAWYISKPGYYASMARLMDAAGGNTKDDVAGGKSLQFLGYPVRIVQVLNKDLSSTGSEVACLFGSLRATAALGTKKDMSIKFLGELFALKNQSGFLGFSRWGINNHELGDASTAGAMIAVQFNS